MENLENIYLEPKHRIRGFINTANRKILSGSFVNYSNKPIEICIYQTGIDYINTAIQMNDYSNESSFVFYCDEYEIIEAQQ